MLRRAVVMRCAAKAAPAAGATPEAPKVKAERLPAGTQSELEKLIETVPIIGAPFTALTNKGTYKELKEIKATSFDPAAQVTTNFIENQKKLVAWRISNGRTQWLEFLDSPAPSSLSGALIFLRTVVLTYLAYAGGYYIASDGYGVELPVVGMLFGSVPKRPEPLPW